MTTATPTDTATLAAWNLVTDSTPWLDLIATLTRTWRTASHENRMGLDWQVIVADQLMEKVCNAAGYHEQRGEPYPLTYLHAATADWLDIVRRITVSNDAWSRAHANLAPPDNA